MLVRRGLLISIRNQKTTL